MPDNKVTVGNVEITSLSDGAGENLMESAFPNVSPDDWKRYPDDISPEGKFPVNFGSFIIRSQGETILVDTGVGPDFPGRLLDELKANGVDPNQITVVAITHLHLDHVAWNITLENEKPCLTFPQAKYWIPQGDWEHYRQPEVLDNSPYIRTMVLPLEELGALRLVNGPASITGEVTTVPTPGHTPGHMSLAISSQGQRGFILGDVANFPFQVQQPAWKMAFDHDPDMASRTREAVLERLEREESTVGGGHFMPPSFGRVLRSEGRRYWQVI